MTILSAGNCAFLLCHETYYTADIKQARVDDQLLIVIESRELEELLMILQRLDRDICGKYPGCRYHTREKHARAGEKHWTNPRKGKLLLSFNFNFTGDL